MTPTYWERVAATGPLHHSRGAAHRSPGRQSHARTPDNEKTALTGAPNQRQARKNRRPWPVTAGTGRVLASGLLRCPIVTRGRRAAGL